MKIEHTTLKFPEIQLHPRDAHKLRGYFANLFRERSPLLHNHFEDGSLRYKYPLVQYKVVDSVPILLGLNEGAALLTEMFLKVSELKIDNVVYPVLSKNLDHFHVEVNLDNQLHTYQFANLWMALNTDNYERYNSKRSSAEKQELLNTVLRNNLLSFFKGVNIWIDTPVMVKGVFEERKTQFKGQSMLAFSGQFVTNALLPDLVGIGKSVSRGFGTIKIV